MAAGRRRYDLNATLSFGKHLLSCVMSASWPIGSAFPLTRFEVICVALGLSLAAGMLRPARGGVRSVIMARLADGYASILAPFYLAVARKLRLWWAALRELSAGTFGGNVLRSESFCASYHHCEICSMSSLAMEAYVSQRDC